MLGRAAFLSGAGITHVSPWELTPLLPEQPHHTVQPQQQLQQQLQQPQQQQQQQLSDSGWPRALLTGDTAARQRLQPDALPSMLQFPLFQTRCVVCLPPVHGYRVLACVPKCCPHWPGDALLHVSHLRTQLCGLSLVTFLNLGLGF